MDFFVKINFPPVNSYKIHILASHLTLLSLLYGREILVAPDHSVSMAYQPVQGCIKCRRPDIMYSGQLLIFCPYPGQIEKVLFGMQKKSVFVTNPKTEI